MASTKACVGSFEKASDGFEEGGKVGPTTGRHRKKGASESQKKRSHQKLAMLELDLGVKTEEINVCCIST